MSRRVQTLVFTDIVGSTDRLRDLGDAAWAGLLARHHELIRAVLAGHHGREVDTAGDGLLARFDAPALALRAAVAAVAAVAPLGIEIRAGLHTGEVHLHGDTMTGLGVHLAARVMAEADPGQVLVSATIRELMAGSGLRFVDLGPRKLKGFPEHWRLYALDPATVQAGEAELAHELAVGSQGPIEVPFPGLLSVGGATGHVGPEEVLGRLEQARREAAAGGCRAVLLCGEPRTGKTRIAGEVARASFDEGAIVLYGRCHKDTGAPYQPFAEALDWYTSHVTRPVLGRHPGELSRLQPLLGARVKGLPAPAPSDPQASEYLLFEATRSWLVELSRRQPVVLVLDDLHWAPVPVLLLLRYVVRAAAAEGDGVRLLVLGTYRDTELGHSHALAESLHAEPEANPFFVERLRTVPRLASSEQQVEVERPSHHTRSRRRPIQSRHRRWSPFATMLLVAMVAVLGGWISRPRSTETGIPTIPTGVPTIPTTTATGSSALDRLVANFRPLGFTEPLPPETVDAASLPTSGSFTDTKRRWLRESGLRRALVAKFIHPTAGRMLELRIYEVRGSADARRLQEKLSICSTITHTRTFRAPHVTGSKGTECNPPQGPTQEVTFIRGPRLFILKLWGQAPPRSRDKILKLARAEAAVAH